MVQGGGLITMFVTADALEMGGTAGTLDRADKPVC